MKIRHLALSLTVVLSLVFGSVVSFAGDQASINQLNIQINNAEQQFAFAANEQARTQILAVIANLRNLLMMVSSQQ